MSANKMLHEKRHIWGTEVLCLFTVVFCCFLLYTDCFEPLRINNGFPAAGRERGRVDFHNSSLLCVNWEITSSILEIGTMF